MLHGARALSPRGECGIDAEQCPRDQLRCELPRKPAPCNAAERKACGGALLHSSSFLVLQRLLLGLATGASRKLPVTSVSEQQQACFVRLAQYDALLSAAMIASGELFAWQCGRRSTVSHARQPAATLACLCAQEWPMQQHAIVHAIAHSAHGDAIAGDIFEAL